MYEFSGLNIKSKYGFSRNADKVSPYVPEESLLCLQRKHCHDFFNHAICPGIDDIHRPFILIADIVVQIEPVTIADVLSVVIFAFLLFSEGLIA